MQTLRQHSRLILGALLVFVSLSLIFVVGYAQALKGYQQQSRDAVLAQTEAARIGLEQILSSGVPLQDIAGLEKVLSPIVDADRSVVDIRVISGQQELYRYTTDNFEASRISIPLRNKFTQVGSLEVLLSDVEVTKAINESFAPMAWLIAISVALFVFMVLQSQQAKIYFTAFGVVFIAMSFSVILMVGALYKSGLENKANSMANIVTHRLSPVLNLGIDPERVSGMDEMLASFRQANDEVSSITVEHQSQVIARSATDGEMMGAESVAQFPISDSMGNQVTISFHPKVLLSQLINILKNFAILFAGCAFICFAFIRLLSRSDNDSQAEVVLAQVKPLLLVTVLMESLMAPVLPQYLADVALANGLDAGWTSYFFTLYFVGFACSLLPVSRLVEQFDIRRVLASGIVLSSFGCLLLMYEEYLALILLARFISGVGQATIFVAIQAYILRFSDKTNKTQAAGIIVFCFNAGFISGAGIGALLADALGINGIFLLSALVGGLMFVFSMVLPSMVPDKQMGGSLRDSLQSMLSGCAALLRVPSFMRTMVLVGIPTKMMLTGVVFFAVPILLSEKGVTKESIGQVLMAYAFAVLFVSGKVAPMIDRIGSTKWALCLGNLIASISLAMLGTVFLVQDSAYAVLIATGSMLVMGLAHGFVNAPVVTHVVNTTSDNDANMVATTYRFLERLGHVLGAIVVGQLLMLVGNSATFWVLSVFFLVASGSLWLFDRPSKQGASA
ncbi:MFS transporter [Photobacterium frigidiphilum]|uniref:MFS transporter n=1 Tax=Photobacterium frigidiphilum TaxID=264736 RepID=A0A2T3JJ01_9GAMM|nr:MFS transporter [Photobacterium frigidiphilum]PSU48970.1 MFS transporter [Photobacterium frigidiphilum]